MSAFSVDSHKTFTFVVRAVGSQESIEPFIHSHRNLDRVKILPTLPDWVDEFSNLVRLEVTVDGEGYSALNTLPESIGKLSRLTSLTISDCAVGSLPASLANCRALRTIKVMRCGINQLHDSLGGLPSLEKLELYDHGFATVPPVIRLLRNLKRLNLGDGSLSQVPSWLVELPLKYLNLSENELIAHDPQNFLTLATLAANGCKVDCDPEMKKAIDDQRAR